MLNPPRPDGIGDPLATFRQRALASGSWTYRHPVPGHEPVERIAFLVEAVRGKRIVHIGCASEAETEKQLRDGALLFARLEESAAGQLGVDPDADGMRRLGQLVRTAWPLQVATLEDVSRELLDRFRPELVLLPEVIEHVPDPGQLLCSARDVASRYGAELLVTVPNALAMCAVGAWASGEEEVHPDHVATYTPRTLQSLLEKCGLVPLEIRSYNHVGRPRITPSGALWLAVRRGTGSVEQRLAAVFRAWFAPRFPDGWIARAAAPSGSR